VNIKRVEQQDMQSCFTACISMLTGIDYDLLPVMPPSFKSKGGRWYPANTAWATWWSLMDSIGHGVMYSNMGCIDEPHIDVMDAGENHHAVVHVTSRVYIDPAQTRPDIVTPYMMEQWGYEKTGLTINVR
jgi:hypothetical protein